MTIEELHDFIRQTPHGMSCYQQLYARQALVSWLHEDRHEKYLSTDEAVMLLATWETKNRYATRVMCVSLGEMIDLACLIQLAKGRRIPQ